MVMDVSAILGSQATERLKSVFTEIDRDGSGLISFEEFKQAFERLSLSFSHEHEQDFFRADVSGDSNLNFSEFCDMYIWRLQKTFQEIDTDNSGKISDGELKGAFKALGYNVSMREVKVLLSNVDKDNDEAVDFQEFCNFFCVLPSPSLRVVLEQWSAGLSLDTGTDLVPPTVPPASIVIWRALLAGGCAGIVSKTVTAPVEKLKILAQTTTGRVPLVGTITSVWKTEKLRGLFAGNGANCLRVFPFSAFVCLAYGSLVKKFPLDDPSQPYNAVWRMGAGAFAGIFATVMTHPLDVVRARLTVQSQNNKSYKGIFDALRKISLNEGRTGLYSGVGLTLVSIAPFVAIQQVSYDVMKEQALRYGVSPSLTLFFMSGSAAGAVAQTVVYPIEVMRRRMQIQSNTHTPFVTTWHQVKKFGIRQLYSGLLATYLKVIPAAAISLVVRDLLLGRLKNS